MTIQEAINIVAQASALASLNKATHIQVDQALKLIQDHVATYTEKKPEAKEKK